MATTATPGSAAPPPEHAAAAPALVARFRRTERALHWVHAAGFFAMLATGLVLYLPGLSASIGDRPSMKAAHLATALAWLTGLAVVTVLGDRRALRRTRREIERFTPDDVAWLQSGGRRGRARVGRFNAGQKGHAAVQAALAGLFVLSGTLLWLGERNTSFRLPGNVALHDGAMFVAGALIAGHLVLALVWPTTRPALRGMVRGSVRAEWAAVHHPAWRPSDPVPSPRPRTAAPRRVLTATLVAALGAVAIAWVVHDTLQAGDPSAPAATGAEALVDRPGPELLVAQAQQAAAAGQFDDAAALLREAIAARPQRADLRAQLGFVLAQSGNERSALRVLDRAIELDRSAPDPYLLRGAVRLRAGRRAAGRRDVRRFERLAPPGTDLSLAQDLLRRRSVVTR